MSSLGKCWLTMTSRLCEREGGLPGETDSVFQQSRQIELRAVFMCADLSYQIMKADIFTALH